MSRLKEEERREGGRKGGKEGVLSAFLIHVPVSDMFPAREKRVSQGRRGLELVPCNLMFMRISFQFHRVTLKAISKLVPSARSLSTATSPTCEGKVITEEDD